jgi:hypothetical protein
VLTLIDINWYCDYNNRDNPIVVSDDKYWDCLRTDEYPRQFPTACVKNVLHFSNGITSPW